METGERKRERTLAFGVTLSSMLFPIPQSWLRTQENE